MKVEISVVRPFHAVKMANALRKHADAVDIWTSATRSRFHHLHPSVKTHLVPSAADVLAHVLKLHLTPEAFQRGIVWWDRMVARLMPR